MTDAAHILGQLLRIGPSKVVDYGNNVAVRIDRCHNFLEKQISVVNYLTFTAAKAVLELTL